MRTLLTLVARWFVCDNATSHTLTIEDRTTPTGTYRPTWQAAVR